MQKSARLEKVVSMEFDVIVDEYNPIDIGSEMSDAGVALFRQAFRADDEKGSIFRKDRSFDIGFARSDDDQLTSLMALIAKRRDSFRKN